MAELTTKSKLFFFFSFSILSPFPTDSFHIVIFKGWETKSNACVFKPPTEGQVYVSDFMFMYILRTISDCCITHSVTENTDCTCLYLARLENYGADDPINVFID